MKVLFYDCFGGISGDMNLAAMFDLGVSPEYVEGELKKLGVGGWKLRVSKDERRGIFGTRADVLLDEEKPSKEKCEHAHEHHHAHSCDAIDSHEHAHGQNCACEGHSHHHHEHRTFADIQKIILDSALSQCVKNSAIKIFEEVAKAEAKAHGKKISEVHFHEVGAVDSIIDIVGTAICADKIGADEVVSSRVELGGGTVRCAHSVMPVPAPAVAEIAKACGAPCSFGGAKNERTTPTGIAILSALCDSFSDGSKCGKKYSGKIIATGIGIGHRSDEDDEVPNFLRVSLCEVSEEGDKNCDEKSREWRSEKMSVLESNIDDDTPEMLSLLCEKLFEAGALDVWQQPIVMKKGRLGVKVCALSPLSIEEKIISVFFKNSTTLGIRRREIDRLSVERDFESVCVDGSDVRVKCARKTAGARAPKKADFDDLKSAAEASGKDIRELAKKAVSLPKASGKNATKLGAARREKK